MAAKPEQARAKKKGPRSKLSQANGADEDT